MKMVSLNTGSFPIRKSERGDLKNFWVKGVHTLFFKSNYDCCLLYRKKMRGNIFYGSEGK